MSVLRFRRGAQTPADVQEAAAWWVARRALGTLSAREEKDFAAWAAAPANRTAFEEVVGICERANDHAGEPEILRMRAEALNARAPARGRGAGWRIAAAALVGMMILGGGGAALWRTTVQRSAAVGDAGEAGLPRAKRYETRIGERREVRLDDGSIVALNTGSLLEVAYNPQRRDVRLLRGQALFQVAHDRAWPFVVAAGDRQVTAVGTAFDVRLEDGRVRVVLVEGKVKVDPVRRRGLQKLLPGLAEEDLAAGQQLVARAGDGTAVITAADVQRATSWRTGQLIFREDSLGSAVAELNRYSARRIVVDDPRLAALPVSGVFSTDRPDNFVAAVTSYFPVKAAQPSPGVTELSWRDPH